MIMIHQSEQANDTNFIRNPNASLPMTPPDAPKSAQELAFNQQGRLSRRQQLRFIGLRLAEHVLGGFTFVVGVTALFIPFRDQALAIGLWLIITGMIILVTLILWLIHIRAAFGNSVQQVTGAISKRVILSTPLHPFFCVTVGSRLFYVDWVRYSDLEDEATYRLFFIERPAHVGGAAVVNAELIAEATPEY
jgi:hypothetical protein